MPETLMNPATEALRLRSRLRPTATPRRAGQARRRPKDFIEIGERIPLEGAPNIRGPVGVEISTSRDDVGTSSGEGEGDRREIDFAYGN